MTTYPVPTAPTGVDAAVWAKAVHKVRGYCGWHIAPAVTETVTMDGTGGPVQFIPTLHVIDLKSVTDDGAQVVDPEWSRSGMIRKHGCWTRKLRGVVAEVEHGYEDWPDDLLDVIEEIAGDVRQGRVSQVTSRSHQVSFDLNIDNEARFSVLDRYRLPFLQ